MVDMDDIPDEVFEDLLNQTMRAGDRGTNPCREIADWLNVHSPPPRPSGPSMIFAADALEWDPEEEDTQPLIQYYPPGSRSPRNISDVEELRENNRSVRDQRKRDGLCPECGDKTRESVVGVCRDHGRFLG